MKLDPKSSLSPCPICSKTMNTNKIYDINLASGFTLGPVCSTDCAHKLYLIYHNFWRLKLTEESNDEVVC